MIEYILLILTVVVGGTVLSAFGIGSTWIVLPLLVLSLPSLYAMLTGSPYLPSDRRTILLMMDLADIQPGEIAIDLGCGDGRLVRAAHDRGAKSIGYELSIFLWAIATLRNRGTVYWSSYWKADVGQADVIFIYIEKKFLDRFEREVWPRIKPGCRVIANTFPLPTLKPTRSIEHIYRYDKS